MAQSAASYGNAVLHALAIIKLVKHTPPLYIFLSPNAVQDQKIFEFYLHFYPLDVYYSIGMKIQMKEYAPVAQLDRASGYGPEGCRFESYREHHFF